MQDNATTYLETSSMTVLEEEKCTVALCRTMPRPTQKNPSMTVLEEENVQLLYAGKCHDLPRKLLNDRPRRRKMYSCFMQDNATTYLENSSMTVLEEENVRLLYAGQCHDLPRKLLNDRPRRRKCTVALCRTMPRPTQKTRQ